MVRLAHVEVRVWRLVMRLILQLPGILLRCIWYSVVGIYGFASRVFTREGVTLSVLPEGAEDITGRAYDRLLQLWEQQELLLHTYQSIFLTVHAVLLAVALALLELELAASARPLMVLGLLLALLWTYLLWDRALAVSFFPMALKEIESGRKVSSRLLEAFAEYRRSIGGLRLTPEAICHLARTQFRSKARVVLGSIPVAFVAVWIYILAMRWSE